MKFNFTVVIQRNSATSLGHAIVIPQMKMRLNISPVQLLQIEKSGYNPILKKLAYAILEKKDDRGDEIPTPRLMDSVLDNVLEKKNEFITEKHDLPLHVVVEFNPKRKCKCCATLLPPLTKLTVLAEVASGTILTIGTLHLTESFIKMDEDTNRAVAITQASLSGVFALWITFAGPGMAFMRDFGATIDDGARNCFQRLCCTKKSTPDDESKQVVSKKSSPRCSTNAKIRLMQGIFLLLAINNMWADATMDYQQLMSLDEAINEDSMLPDWLVNLAAYTMFAFNQLNDPLQILTLIIMGFNLIRLYYTENKPENEDDYSESETADWIPELAARSASVGYRNSNLFSFNTERSSETKDSHTQSSSKNQRRATARY